MADFALSGKQTNPNLLDIRFSRTGVGTVNKGFGLISTIIGTLAGGSLIATSMNPTFQMPGAPGTSVFDLFDFRGRVDIRRGAPS